MIPFQMGCGGCDVAKMLSMLGISESRSFTCNFSRNSKSVTSVICRVSEEAIEEGLKIEIVATLKSEWDKNKPDDELKLKTW